VSKAIARADSPSHSQETAGCVCASRLRNGLSRLFPKLGHDNHRRVCRVYGWEEKKTKASWGMTVDYEAIAGKAVGEMSAQDIHRFFVVCALVSDLYCPRFNPRESLAKDSNLARTAARYKIDSAKISTEVRTELTKNKSKKLGREKNE
jgi:hypothetical protein